MIILSIDSAGTSCSACVWQDGEVLSEAEETMERGQDQRLMPLTLEVLKDAGLTFEDIDRVAVTRGPGSFTGLRIGLAAARGISLAANKPIIGIERFSIYREQIKTPGKNLLVVIDSKRADLFCRFYPADGSMREPTMMLPDEIRKFLTGKSETIVTGDTPFESNCVFMAATEKEAAICAMLASRAEVGDPEFTAKPLYIREPDVTLPRTA